MNHKMWQRKFGRTTIICCLFFIISVHNGYASNTVFLDEKFSTLDQWKPLIFPKIKRHTNYTIQQCDNMPCLHMESNNSASGLLLDKTFNIYEYPILKWRWKVSNVYIKGDSTTKDGDDYPARIYVLFLYNPEKSTATKRIKYELAKLLYGQYPPDSSISYIWDNRETKNPFIVSAFTDRARMIPVSSGTSRVNTWQEYTVNIVSDYKMAFGQDPPSLASLAVMCDSDNTHESASASIQYIRIESLH